MITVRSPNGFSIQYNSANYVVNRDGFYDLFTDSNKTTWVARVPNGWLIECMRPCRTYDGNRTPDDLLDAFLQAVQDREVSGYRLAAIKRALGEFNALTKKWKS